MTFGLTDEEFHTIVTTVVEPLVRRGATVWCFGSRARGEHQRFSDLDLLVESDEDLSALVSEISEQLEESHFPYKVDLVTTRELESTYRDSVFAQRVEFEV